MLTDSLVNKNLPLVTGRSWLLPLTREIAKLRAYGYAGRSGNYMLWMAVLTTASIGRIRKKWAKYAAKLADSTGAL
jgi:hypothetical protein